MYSPARIPDNESARLAALRRTGILDTPPEPAYDALAQTAAHLCGTPIALVSLVDVERQWFKARVGLEAEQTARDISFCGHAIHGDELFEVVDPLSDERFRDNPLVQAPPALRFYAGAPLMTESGHRLGTLCVIDQQPHAALTDAQRGGLQALAAAASSLLQQRVWKRERRRQRSLLEVLESDRHELQWMLSHSLAEPLRSVVGHLQLLRRRYGAQWPDAANEYANLAIDNAHRMRRLIDDLLTFTQMSQQPLHPERVELAELLTIAWQGLAAQDRRPDSQLLTESALPAVFVDPSQFLVLLRHLLSNAVRYTPASRPPRVQVRAAQNADGTQIWIQDNGCGLEPHVADRVFHLFAHAGESAGPGVGLTLAQRVAQRHLGRLKITQTSPAGTTVLISLPGEADLAELLA